MTYTDPDIETDETGEDAGESNDIRNLRRKAKEADKLRAEVEDGNAARRELAFIKAGVETDSPIGSMFMRAYDGELTPEAIQEAYAELGGTTDSTEGDEVDNTDEAAEATRERQSLAAGAASDTGEQPPAPVRGLKGSAVKAGQEAIQNGAPREDAIGATFGALVAAAAEGDRSVIVPGIGQQ